MKKKLLAVMMSCTLILSMAACGDTEETDTTAPEDSVVSEEVIEDVSEDVVDDTTDTTVVESLWDLEREEVPDLTDTVWTFCGGCVKGVEMEQEQVDSALESVYGGTLQIAFDGEGGAQMIQGGGTLNGTYEPMGDNGVGVAFDNNGTELRYGCIFTKFNDTVAMIAIADEEGLNAVYFAQ